MKQSFKWTFLFAALFMLINASYALSIGSKGRVNGPSIHTTYFITPNNSYFPIHAQAYVGKFINGTCQYNAIYDLGNEMLKTGDFIDIDAFKLKSVIGVGYTCMTIFYTYKQIVLETFQLGTDGINYNASFPATSEVTIL